MLGATECLDFKCHEGLKIDCPFSLQWLTKYCDQCPKKEPNKMTREEALKIVDNQFITSKSEPIYFINALEALGLIKFDKPVEQWASAHSIIAQYISLQGADNIINLLDKGGYKIVKKDGTKA